MTYPNNRAVIAYTYDTAGHQVKAESLWGTGLAETFYQVQSFNRFGRPQQYVYGNGVTTQHEFYPISNRLKRVHTYKGTTNLMDLVYSFDRASNIVDVDDQITRTGSQSYNLEAIQYDDLYRIKSARPGYQTGQLSYTYDAKGNVVTNGELGTSTYVYGSSKPHAVTQVGSSTYGYDACGNMTNRNRAGKANQTLTYDAENRLAQVVDANNVQFGYSAGDSRLWKKVNGQVTGLWIGGLYEEKNGKILCHVYADGQIVATFEPQGYFACTVENQPILAGLWHGLGAGWYGLFGGGRLPVTVMCGAALAGIALGLRYNRRRLWAKYGIETYYGIPAIGGKDPWRQMVLLSLAGSIFLSSVPQSAFADSPTYDPVFYYYQNDHLGSASIMTDRQGNVVQRYGYTPFGKERYKDNTLAFKVSSRYTGQTLDDETGLYYYGARYYDPEIARFVQADTAMPDPEFSQACNRYAYVYNNPIKFTDPSGQNPFLIGLAISMAISGGMAAATGGNVIRAMITGALCYFVGFGVGQIAGTFEVCGWGLSATGCAMVGGAAAGALSATMQGGSPFLGAVMGAASAGAGAVLGDALPNVFKSVGDKYLRELVATTVAGALIGGVTSEVMGGGFGEGAVYGAATAAAGYIGFRMVKTYIADFRENLAKSVKDVAKQKLLDTLKDMGVESTGVASGKVAYDLTIDSLDVEIRAEGFAADMINDKWINSAIEGRVEGFANGYRFHDPSADAIGSDYWLKLNLHVESEAAVKFTCDIYSGADLLQGRFQAVPDVLHLNKTTLEFAVKAHLRTTILVGK